MKILLVTEFFPTGRDLRYSGGVETRTYFLAKYLAKNHRVSVISSRQKGSKDREKLSGFHIHRVGPTMRYTPGNASILDAFSLMRFMYDAIKIGSNLDVDIVDGGNFNAHFIAKEIARRKKIPSVYWYPDIFIGKWIQTSGVLTGLSGWILENFNLKRPSNEFIAISRQTQKKLIENGINKNKITVIPCGVDPNEFKTKTKKYHHPTIICISRLVHYKNVKDLVFAFALCLRKNSKLRLVIVGSGPEKKRLENLAKQLKIQSKIQFFENLPRKILLEKLMSSHLLCLPSKTEGFGIATIEAAAAGIPYVVSDIEVFKEITKNGKGGLLFRLGDIKDLASKIENLITNRSLYQKKVKEAKNLVKDYEWIDIAQKTEKVYEELLEN